MKIKKFIINSFTIQYNNVNVENVLKIHLNRSRDFDCHWLGGERVTTKGRRG